MTRVAGKCINCNIQLISKIAKRCKRCAALVRWKNETYVQNVKAALITQEEFQRRSENSKRTALERWSNEDFKTKMNELYLLPDYYKTKSNATKLSWITNRETRYAATPRGINHPNSGIITPWFTFQCKIEKYQAWKISVHIRDAYTCKACGSTTSLEAHHIVPRSTDISRQYDINNGITLCVKCHRCDQNCAHSRLRKSPEDYKFWICELLEKKS